MGFFSGYLGKAQPGVSDKTRIEVRLWASMRSQTVMRTVQGAAPLASEKMLGNFGFGDMFIYCICLKKKTEYFLRSFKNNQDMQNNQNIHNLHSTWRRLELFCRIVAPRSTITLLWRLILPLCDPAAQRTSFAFQFVAPRFVWVGSRAKVSTFSDFQKAAVGEICGSWAYMQILNKILPNIPKRQGPGIAWDAPNVSQLWHLHVKQGNTGTNVNWGVDLVTSDTRRRQQKG